MRANPRLIASAIFISALFVPVPPHSTSRQQSVFRSIEQHLGVKAPIPYRIIAANEPKCLADRMTPENILREVQRQETAAAGPAVQGRWEAGGISLSQLPAPQARFLSFQNGKWIRAERSKVENCTDVYCVINSIYGSATGNEASKVYGWYLRTGYFLSMTNQVPQLGMSSTLKDHLFNDGELNELWRISFELPESLKYLKTLATVHRVPDRILPADWIETTSSYTAGDAGAEGGSGFIRMGKHGCDLSRENRMRKVLTHELGHRLDVLRGKHDYFSTKDPKWTGFSGWECTSYVEDGYQHFKCNSAKDAVFVTDYASTSPMEDWSETIAEFRYDPKATLQRIPNKAAYIEKEVFGGRSYTPEGQKKYFEEFARAQMDRQLLDMVGACSNSEDATAPTAGSGVLKIDGILPAGWTDCLNRQFNIRLTEALDLLRATEMDACTLLKDQDKDLGVRIGAAISPRLSELAQIAAKEYPAVRAALAVRNRLKEETDPRQLWIRCWNESNSETCFTTALSAAFDDAARAFPDLTPGLLEQERKAYLAEQSFEKTRVAVRSFWLQLVSGAEGMVGRAARARWESCQSAPDPGQVPAEAILMSPFNGGANFVPANVLNCTNGNVVADLDGILEKYFTRLGITVSDPGTANYVRSVLQETYLAVLSDELAAVVRKETDARSVILRNNLDAWTKRVTEKVDWLGDTESKTEAQDLCRPVARGVIEATAPAEAAPLGLRYVQLADAYPEWAETICTESLKAPAAQAWMAGAPKRLWSRAIKELEEILLQRVAQKFPSCQSKKPKSARQWCLNNGWYKHETDTIADWLSRPLGKRFATSKKQAADYLVKNRAYFQQEALKRMDGNSP